MSSLKYKNIKPVTKKIGMKKRFQLISKNDIAFYILLFRAHTQNYLFNLTIFRLQNLKPKEF